MNFNNDDDEDQIMFDLYEGLDTFDQTVPEKVENTDNATAATTVNNGEEGGLGSDQTAGKAADFDKPTVFESDYLGSTDAVAVEHGYVPIEEDSDENINQINSTGNNGMDQDDESCGIYGENENEDDGDVYDEESDEDEDDGVVFLVEEDEGTIPIEPSQNEAQSLGRRRPGGWATRYHKIERVIYVGAPSSESQAMASTDPKKECFCLVRGIPWWMDINEFNNVVEESGAMLAFSKILSDPMNGASLGVALVEFVDPESLVTFSKVKSQFIATEIPQDVFEDVLNSPLYREGVLKDGMINRIVSHLGLEMRRTIPNGKSDHFHEIEFEIRQQEILKDGEPYNVSKVFPWFKLNMLKVMGYKNRNEQPDTSSPYDLVNHLEAYKKTQESHNNNVNLMMPQFMMANYMQHTGKDMGEPASYPYLHVTQPAGQPEPAAKWQKYNLSANRDVKDKDRASSNEEPHPNTNVHRSDRERNSPSPHSKRRSSPHHGGSHHHKRSHHSYNERRNDRK